MANKKQSLILVLICVLLFGLSLSIPRPASSQAAMQTPIYLPYITKPDSSAIAGCPVFPADNVWNHRVDSLPVDSQSPYYIASIGANIHLHPDFGTVWDGGPIGIPYNIVSGTQAKVPVSFDIVGENDAGPYPIPSNPNIEYGSDHHILIVDKDACKLYELWDARLSNGAWYAGSGAIFDLKSNALRHDTWTSADAAGLPILPGLVRYDEVASGVINHAIRFTVNSSQNKYIWPARHQASSNANTNLPPMGQRFRLKSSVTVTGVSAEVQTLITAFKQYGLIVADNGSSWYISGAPDSRWNDDALVSGFNKLKGSDFEAVDESSLKVSNDSGQTH